MRKIAGKNAKTEAHSGPEQVRFRLQKHRETGGKSLKMAKKDGKIGNGRKKTKACRKRTVKLPEKKLKTRKFDVATFVQRRYDIARVF